MSRPRIALVWLLTCVIVAGLVGVALAVGRYGLSPGDVLGSIYHRLTGTPPTLPATAERIVWNVRWPRVLVALTIGAALAAAGVGFQAVLRNPLVSPDILGVTSGAGLGAALGIFAGAGMLAVQGFAFVGGLLAAGAALAIPRLLGRDSIVYLVLSGIIVGSVVDALLGLVTYLVPTENTLARIVFWLMGSLTAPGLGELASIAGPLALGAGALLLLAWRINVLALGADTARRLGVDVGRVRTLVLLACTLLTASAVSISGTIGWVGLVMPHLARRLVGADHRVALPYAMLLGGGFLLAVDTLARTIAPAEIPLSIVTGLVGAPFYLWVLVRTREAVR